MHKKTALTVFFISGLLFTSMTLAIRNKTELFPESCKIGVIDIYKLMNETKAANKAISKIHKKYAAENKELTNAEHLLQNKIIKLNKNKKLKLEDQKELQLKIANQRKKLQDKRDLLQKKVTASQNLEAQELIVRFLRTVSKIAIRENLDLVLFKDVTFANLANLDLTDEVIKLYMHNFKK